MGVIIYLACFIVVAHNAKWSYQTTYHKIEEYGVSSINSRL